jgi:hypothetical protein
VGSSEPAALQERAVADTGGRGNGNSTIFCKLQHFGERPFTLDVNDNYGS